LTCFATLALASLGCFHVEYLLQAALGQDDIAFRTRAISEVVDDATVPRRTRDLLLMVAHAKRFGEGQGLVATGNYDGYADLQRPAAVWVVSASQPLRFEAETWTFPIIGSVPYLGWFERRDADRHAARLRRRGLDVDLRAARAYSTLGWFDDPVLSTMIRRGDAGLAGLIDVVLHESVHSTLYIESQSRFNESLASFVARRLTREFLQTQISQAAARAYAEAEQRGQRRRKRMHAIYKRLDKLYRSPASDGEKRAKKAEWLAALTAELNFKRPINNATLAQSRTYEGGNPSFDRLLARCGSVKQMMAELACLGSHSFASSQQRDLAPILDPLCQGSRAVEKRAERNSSRRPNGLLSP
jgi:predicted aminopeptidase